MLPYCKPSPSRAGVYGDFVKSYLGENMAQNIELKVRRLTKEAELPTYGSASAACFDIRTTTGGIVEAKDSALFSTGLSFEIPEGWAMMVYSRSGHGFKHGIRLANATGIIDSDYRGEAMVRLTNDGGKAYEVQPGERVAQAMLIPAPAVSIEEVDELSATERGEGGFGSTGTI